MPDNFFIRYRSAVPNSRGAFPGLFALANGLAHDQVLNAEDMSWWEAANRRMNETYAHPDAQYFDRETYPGAASWFRSSAGELLELTRGYLTLLTRYSVPWVELRTATPGCIIYRDEVQVVATAYTYDEHWSLTDGRPVDSSRS